MQDRPAITGFFARYSGYLSTAALILFLANSMIWLCIRQGQRKDESLASTRALAVLEPKATGKAR